jgi:hypothetical protein
LLIEKKFPTKKARLPKRTEKCRDRVEATSALAFTFLRKRARPSLALSFVLF